MQISGSAENLFYSLTVKELSEDVPGIPWHNYIINKILAPYHFITKDERIIRINLDYRYLQKLVDFLSKTPKRFFLAFSFFSCCYYKLLYIQSLMHKNQ